MLGVKQFLGARHAEGTARPETTRRYRREREMPARKTLKGASSNAGHCIKPKPRVDSVFYSLSEVRPAVWKPLRRGGLSLELVAMPKCGSGPPPCLPCTSKALLARSARRRGKRLSQLDGIARLILRCSSSLRPHPHLRRKDGAVIPASARKEFLFVLIRTMLL
jgi:hypothetical protein